VRAEQCTQGSAAVPAFVQLPCRKKCRRLAAATAQAPSRITVEIRRGGTTVQAELPLDARSAAWLREVLG
jgi:hypothetical protein